MNQYIREYTGIVKLYDDSDTSNYNATLVEGQYIIDAKDSCNILKYCNHSCKPNAYLRVCRDSLSGELRVTYTQRKILYPSEKVCVILEFHCIALTVFLFIFTF